MAANCCGVWQRTGPQHSEEQGSRAGTHPSGDELKSLAGHRGRYVRIAQRVSFALEAVTNLQCLTLAGRVHPPYLQIVVLLVPWIRVARLTRLGYARLDQIADITRLPNYANRIGAVLL